MSSRRLRFDESGCYYHIFNRVAGMPDDYPFGDVEKEFMFTLINCLSKFYLIEVVAFVAMGNHYHAVLYAPGEDIEISDQEVKERWKARKYHKLMRKETSEPDWSDREKMEKLKANMRDISAFTGQFQWCFTKWYKNERPAGKGRRGSMWAGRFKNTVLGNGDALWYCTLYAELNPMRAGISKDLRIYRFGSFGRYCGKGRHPFAENLEKHLCGEGKRFDSIELMMKEMEKVFCVVYSLIYGDEVSEEDQNLVSLASRSRYFCESGIIGTKAFVGKVMSRFYTTEQVARRKFTEFAEDIFSLRRLAS